MFETIIKSPALWITMTVGLYLLGDFLKQKWPNPFFNPLFFGTLALILILLIFDIPIETYDAGGQVVSLFITPATVALAIKLDENFDYLKDHYLAILTGIVLGVLFHTVILYILALLFRFQPDIVATLIPKSITTAIAVGVSENLGGIVPLTVAVVVFTGIFGATFGKEILRLADITDPLAQGVALGAASHAMGTARAIELGDLQGAMSALTIVVTGITVVALAPLTIPITNLLF